MPPRKRSILSKFLIGLAAFIGAALILGYAFQDWLLRNYGASPHPVPKEILNVDRGFPFPANFPPDPGDAGKETIAGIDSDNDGVRDDVQRWIYAMFPSEPKKQMALRQDARSIQDSLRDDFDQLKVRQANSLLIERAVNCVDKTFDNELRGYLESQYLTAKVLNTYARTVRYWENNRKITTKEASGPLKDFDTPCDDK